MTPEEYKKYYEEIIEPIMKKCWENKLNNQLKNEYENLPALDITQEEVKKNLSCPFFIHLGQKYTEKKGIFIIGQETHGWGGKEDSVGKSFRRFEECGKANKAQTMMEIQSEWLLLNYQYYIDSDFHNAVKAITGIATGKGFLESQFVWDNLIAVDYKKGSYRSLKKDCRDKIISYSQQKLIKELSIAKPKLAIFFIGSYADGEDCFWSIFKGRLKKNDVEEVDDCPNLLHFDLNIDKHKIECYATNHPSYKGWVNKNDVLRKLAEIVREAQK